MDELGTSMPELCRTAVVHVFRPTRTEGRVVVVSLTHLQIASRWCHVVIFMQANARGDHVISNAVCITFRVWSVIRRLFGVISEMQIKSELGCLLTYFIVEIREAIS